MERGRVLRLLRRRSVLKPPPFAYEMAESISEATSLLVEHELDAKVLAGGQSLVPLMSFRLLRPGVVVDVNRIPGLDYIRIDEQRVSIGALTRHRTVEQDGDLAVRLPMLRDALKLVGHVGIRNRGTVGGSLAHADPAAEWPALVLALDADVTVAGRSGSRQVHAEDFFLGYMSTTLQPDELVTAVDLMQPPPGAGSAFVEFARRHGDYAQAGAGAVVALRDGRISYARATLLGVGMTPIRARGVEEALIGEHPDKLVLQSAARVAEEAMQPLDDIHASRDYRRHLGVVMLRRALARAVERAQDVA